MCVRAYVYNSLQLFPNCVNCWTDLVFNTTRTYTLIITSHFKTHTDHSQKPPIVTSEEYLRYVRRHETLADHNLKHNI